MSISRINSRHFGVRYEDFSLTNIKNISTVLSLNSSHALGTSSGPTGPTGPNGFTGPTGPAGILFTGSPNATGNYLAYNGTQWTVAKTKVFLGNNAGMNGGSNTVAIGNQAGQYSQSDSSIAIGNFAGQNTQQPQAVAIGATSGFINQGDSLIAIGASAGLSVQGMQSVAIGQLAGFNNQARNAVAIGFNAGSDTQGLQAVAIGNLAGQSFQRANAIAIGSQAGRIVQGTGSIAIGQDAGQASQGSFSVAIGYQAGKTNQHSNTIILNATGDALNSSTSNALYIAPIRSVDSGASTSVLTYDTANKEVYLNTGKTFVIDHPSRNDRYLVHGCLEGPELGVYYRGVDEIVNDSVQIVLPDYVHNIAKQFTIHITPFYNKKLRVLNCSEVYDNKFTVYGEPGKFSWIVHGLRVPVETEPVKTDYVLRGDGPYTYLSKNIMN